MKLVPKARPVRIRIKSSGEEHSSFDSLKKALSFDDLKEPACDGRLSNWLRQQDKNNVAERIDALKQKLAANVITEDSYLRFFCAIFCEEVNDSSIFSKSDLYDWWSKSKFNQGKEYEILEKEVIASRLKANKAKEDDKMKHDYSYAIKVYDEHKGSRTQTEWVEIFRSHMKNERQNGNFWWILYELTQQEDYLSQAAARGHSKAKELFEASKGRFDLIRKGDFRLRLSNLPKSLPESHNFTCAQSLISQIETKTQFDADLKKELKDIFIECERVLGSGSGAVFNCFINYQFKYLEPEKCFIQGILYEMIKEDPKPYYDQSAKQGYKPAKLKQEQFSEHTQSVKRGYDVIQAFTGQSRCRALICNGDKIDSSVMTFGNRTRENKDKVGKILSFIIRHLFDEYEV